MLHKLARIRPHVICIGAPRRVRATLPEFIDLREEQMPEEDVTIYEGLRTTTAARALLDCRGHVMALHLLEAARQARAEGLLTGPEYAQIRSALNQKTQAA